MTATTDRTPLQALAAKARVDQLRDALTATDASLDAHIALIACLSKAHPEDLDEDGDTGWALARVQTQLAFIASTLREAFDATVRSAPPSGLAEVVRDVMVECIAPTCDVMRAPWESTRCHTAECVREVKGAFGVDE